MGGKLPSNARSTTNERGIFRRLDRFHGLAPTVAGHRLHEIKLRTNRGAGDQVFFDLTGGVYDPHTLDWLGALTEGNK
jgi:hypothetical protein